MNLRHAVVVIALLLAALTSAPALGLERSEPTATPVPRPGLLPAVADGDTTVRFSLAPATAEDTELTALTRWRSCGVLEGDDELFDDLPEPAGSRTGTPATAHLVEADDEVRIRIDVGTGPTGEPCEATSLVRIPVNLGRPLGERVVRDAADATYEPLVNEVDSFETGLIYSCNYHGGFPSFSVAELLGPGLEHPADLAPPATTLRIVRLDGDRLSAIGPVKPNGRVHVQTWLWGDGHWDQAWWDGGCHLIADSALNQATATWRLRGRPPTSKSRTIRMWVTEHVCNGRPLYGRVAQPIWINAPDGIVFVMSSMRDTVRPDGTYIEDPWEYYKGKPGVAGHRGGFQFIDCPGIGPAPYTVNLHQRLGDRKLYDGARFPPQERPRRR